MVSRKKKPSKAVKAARAKKTKLPKMTHVGVFVPVDITIEELANMAHIVNCRMQLTTTLDSWRIVMHRK